MVHEYGMERLTFPFAGYCAFDEYPAAGGRINPQADAAIRGVQLLPNVEDAD